MFTFLATSFKNWKENKRKKNSWKMVFQDIGRWHEDNILVDESIYYLYENELGQRKCVCVHGHGDNLSNPKDHKLYQKRIYPWLNGLSVNNYPYSQLLKEDVNVASRIVQNQLNNISGKAA
jgi:hypothetical protein